MTARACPPAVSIVLPTRNGQAFLAQSIESCLAQTYPGWELIIVDDASTDATPAMISDYASRDARIRSLRHDVGRNLPAALNTGSEACRGVYLTWTSDDNVFRPTAIEEMVGVLSDRPSVDIVYADYELIDDAGTVLGPGLMGRPEDLLEADSIGACFLYRRAVHDSLGGYDLELFLCEDYDFWLRAYLAGFTFMHLPRKLYGYRTHPGSLSATRRDAVLVKTRQAQAAQVQGWARKAHAQIVGEYLRIASFATTLRVPGVARFCLTRVALIAPGWLRNRSFRSRLARSLVGRPGPGDVHPKAEVL